MRPGRERLEQLYQESLALIDALRQQVAGLQEQIAAQQALIQQLQDQRAKDSHNSGKPPSSDGLKKGRRKSLRKSGQRPRGGQRGHKGRTLLQVAEPEHVVVHGLAGCPQCQTELTDVAVEGACETAGIRHTTGQHRSDGASGGGEAVSWLWCVRAGRISLPRDATDAVWSSSEGVRLLPVQSTVHPPGAHQRVADCTLRSCALGADRSRRRPPTCQPHANKPGTDSPATPRCSCRPFRREWLACRWSLALAARGQHSEADPLPRPR